jgi:hypothetical protein
MNRLINSDSTVTHLWSPIALRNLADKGNMFSETLILTVGHWAELPPLFDAYSGPLGRAPTTLWCLQWPTGQSSRHSLVRTVSLWAELPPLFGAYCGPLGRAPATLWCVQCPTGQSSRRSLCGPFSAHNLSIQISTLRFWIRCFQVWEIILLYCTFLNDIF